MACCSTSCGACGGSECSSREGGGDACCTSDIIEKNELCTDKGVAPCLIVPQPGGDDSPDIPDGGEHREPCPWVHLYRELVVLASVNLGGKLLYR